MAAYILASKSPRRKMLLRNLVDPFIVVNPEVAEQKIPGESPAEFVVRLAEEKAIKVGEGLSASFLEGVLVIAADTIVVDGREILGKPLDAGEAVRVLHQLQGKTHQVLSGIALNHPSSGKLQTHLVCTEVEMRMYTEKEILAYVESGDPLDKAGSYGIQNRDFNPSPDFKGCQANVMGLPLCHLAVLMNKMGFEANRSVADHCQKSIGYLCPVHDGILADMNRTSSKRTQL